MIPEMDELLLKIIAALLGVGLGAGVFFGRMILTRLDSLGDTNDEQWSVIRAHERELGELQAFRKMKSPVPAGD